MKRILSWALTLFLCLGLLSAPAGAASGSASLNGPGTVRAGSTITLTFKVNGSSIYGVEGSLSYDSSQLTLTGTSQKIKSPWIVEFNGNNFVAYDNNLSSPIDSNTALFTATFKVKSNLSAGTTISVSCKNVLLSDGSSDTSVGTVTYSNTIAPPLSGNCDLGSLTVGNAEISPAFSADVTSYTASVPFEVSKLDLSAKAAQNGAKVEINNPNLTPNGTTNVTITVTAENGTKKTYTIAVTRAQDPNYVPSSDCTLSGISVEGFLLSPVFSADVTEYVIWLPYETESVTVSGTAADKKASVSVTGGSQLEAGADNRITVTCTAEDGTKKEYIIIAKRAAAHGESGPDLSDYQTDSNWPGLYFLTVEEDAGEYITAYMLLQDQLILVGGYREYPANNYSGLTGPDGVEEQIAKSPEQVYAMFEDLLANACRFLDPNWSREPDPTPTPSVSDSTTPPPSAGTPSTGDTPSDSAMGKIQSMWLIVGAAVVCLILGLVIGVLCCGRQGRQDNSDSSRQQRKGGKRQTK